MAVYQNIPDDPIKKRRKVAKQIMRQRIGPPMADMEHLMAENMPMKKAAKKAMKKEDMPMDKEMPMKKKKAMPMMAETKGFEANAKKIAKKQDIPVERARAILASGARKASPAAKKANPALKNVKGSKKK